MTLSALAVLLLDAALRGAVVLLLALGATRLVRRAEVVGILPGGSPLVEAKLYPDYPDPLKPGPGATTTRRLEARRTAGGGVRWTYRVNGAERPFEGEARAWFDRVLRKHAAGK